MEEQLTDLFHTSLFHTGPLGRRGLPLKIHKSLVEDTLLLPQKALWTGTQ